MNVLKHPSADIADAKSIAVAWLVTAAFLPVVFGVFAHGAFLAAHSLSELTSGRNWDARLLEIPIGDVSPR